MAAGSTYTPIATTTLGSAQASYTFSSISGSYTDLILIAAPVYSSSTTNFAVQVGNGSVDTGSNYSYTRIYGDGTSAASDRETSYAYAALGILGANGNMIGHFQNYANTTTYKTILGRGNSSSYVSAYVSLWRSTSAINIIKVYPANGANFNSGTSLTLYGIAAA